MAEDEERAKKRQRLTGNDWEAKVLGVGDYSKFLPDNKVPFVNRHNELCDLFHVNAAVILKLLECRRDKEGIDNWRPCSVAMAAQMFGSGKTTLGRNFIKQLKDQETNNFIQEKLTGDDWRDELTRAQRAESKHYNLNGCKTLHDVAKMLDYDQFKALSSTGALDIAKYIFRLAVETGEKPLFVHFDEIGDLQANVKELREAVRQVWELMLQYAGDMPRVYFFLSGKSVPLNAIGGSGFPVGTKWIILDLLKEEHIRCIVNAATSASTNSLCPSLAKMQELPAALQLWTGGSPRLLVYSLRVLHHLLNESKQFDSAEQAMEAVFEILKNQKAVASEVFLDQKDEAEWQQTWLYLILLAQLRVPCRRETFLPVGSAEHSLDVLLGRLNVYISKPEQPIEGMSDAFYISHMKMVEKFVREKYSSDCRVPLFLGGEAAGISAEDLLERMVEQRIIVQACMCQGQRWGDVMKPLLHGTQAETLAVVLDQGCPLDTFPKITSAVTERKTISLPLPANLHPGNLAAAMQRLNSNRLYRPAPKSNSADLFIKQQELIIELQDKSGVTAGVSFFDACQEVAKCIQEGPVLWVLVALKLTDSLLCCVGTKKPLLLTPGVYQEEKSAEGGLLYRPNGKSKKWQKRILHGTWSDLGSSRVEAKDTSRLEVREGLELVIPHPEHVKTFLGDDFEIVKKLAERRKDDAPGGMIKIPFLSRFYNFQKPHAQGSAAPAQPSVIWARQLRKDGTTIEVAGNAFKVTGAIADVDDLKKAIKAKEELSIAASKLDVYSQQDGHWVKVDEDIEVSRGTSKSDCYGFTLPQKTDDV